MDAIRVEIEGPTASFRYAHFLIGRQPTYPMPPPSTVYGLISGALGDYPDPTSLRFAYRFAREPETVDDLELLWFIFPPDTKWMQREWNVQASSNVQTRELLVQPRMTLYLAGTDLDHLYEAFRTPRYLPVLGRSQDIVSFRRVDRVRLEKRRVGRFDESLLPISLRDRMRYGSSINFPRFIEPHKRRHVVWDWFIALAQPVMVGPEKQFEPAPDEIFWADPDTVDAKGNERLLLFHHFKADSEVE